MKQNIGSLFGEVVASTKIAEEDSDLNRFLFHHQE